MQAETAAADAGLLPFGIIFVLVSLQEGPDRADQALRLIAVGILAAEPAERRVAGENLGLVVFQHDHRGGNVDGIEITLASPCPGLVRIRTIRRRESARFPKGHGTPLAAADARNLHWDANSRKNLKISSALTKWDRYRNDCHGESRWVASAPPRRAPRARD